MTNRDNKLRDILNCTCSWNRAYDGKSWNNKTQTYDDCSCVETLPHITALLEATLEEREKFIRFDEANNAHIQMLFIDGFVGDKYQPVMDYLEERLSALQKDLLDKGERK